MLATGGGHLKKIFRTYQRNFPDRPKNIPDIWYFSRKWKKFSGNNIDSSFQKCPLGKKCNLNDIFHARKGHFALGKRALGKTWGGLARWLPRFLRPCSEVVSNRQFVTSLLFGFCHFDIKRCSHFWFSVIVNKFSRTCYHNTEATRHNYRYRDIDIPSMGERQNICPRRLLWLV
jgi:hypothetical protein